MKRLIQEEKQEMDLTISIVGSPRDIREAISRLEKVFTGLEVFVPIVKYDERRHSGLIIVRKK
jgi:hypothetical protein